MSDEMSPPEDIHPGGAADAWFSTVYQELREMAGRRLRKERANHSLRPTELVHEVFLRIGGQRNLSVKGREHFLALSGLAMRRILVEHARRRSSLKRGGGLLRVTLEDDVASAEDGTVDMLALDQAMSRLEKRDPEAAEVVQHRFFAGLTEAEVATLLGKSDRWVREQWAFARAWILRELSKEA